VQQARSIVRASDLKPKPWPNGLGITRDIVAQNRSEAHFDWLISIADLTESAAFSHFLACDRIFTLIEGDGVTLTLDHEYPMPCTPLVPASFPGDHPTHCTMGNTPARAFNVFIDRRSFDGQVAVRTIAGSHAIRSAARTAAIFCIAGMLDVDGDILAAGDTSVGGGAATIRASDGPATAIIVEIERRDRVLPGGC
jgi:environmental stress-induced protein Ves